MPDRDEELLGTVLDGRYRVEAALGSAHSGGTIFRGRDAKAGTTVVVRCPLVPPRLTSEQFEEALALFVAEAELLARVGQGSTDVERLLASGIAERAGGPRVPFTIFEWLLGRSLERHLAERAPGGSSVSEALVTLQPAARALATAHALGAAHRDVRPANLWLAELGGRTTLKVAAFGLATRIGPVDPAFAPEYGAPEHFKRSYGAVGPATDVYGLALCLVEMVTGKRALDGADEAELYLSTSDLTRRPTLRARGAHVSDAVEAVLLRALAVDPRRRWPSARELWDALVAAVPEMTPAPPSVRVGTSDRPPGLAAPGHLGSAAPQDSGPASVPPGVVRGESAKRAPGDAAKRAPGDAAKRAPSVRPAATPTVRGSAPDTPERSSARSASLEGRDRSGTRAWMVVAAVAVLAGGVVAAKVGGAGSPPTPTAPEGPRAASAAASASSPSRSAAASTRASDEPAVRVTPFLLDMVKVPAASFVMGSDHDGKPERPAHRVTLSHAFYIDRTEVRADAYAACVADKECTPNRVHSAEAVETAWGCNTDTDRPKHPANCVDRVQAGRYCAYVQKRLPTEAEWEYAARGNDGREFPWGNAPPATCAVAVLTGMVGECGNRHGTWEVGTTAEGMSAFGALDMAGNVWEWVADGYEPYPADAASDGGGIKDPQPPLAPGARSVLRGGSWDYAVASAKVTYRLPFVSTSGNVSIGFRCARDGD